MSIEKKYQEKSPVDDRTSLKMCEQFGISKEVISHFIVLKRKDCNE